MSFELKAALFFAAGAVAAYAFVKYQDKKIREMGTRGI